MQVKKTLFRLYMQPFLFCWSLTKTFRKVFQAVPYVTGSWGKHTKQTNTPPPPTSSWEITWCLTSGFNRQLKHWFPQHLSPTTEFLHNPNQICPVFPKLTAHPRKDAQQPGFGNITTCDLGWLLLPSTTEINQSLRPPPPIKTWVGYSHLIVNSTLTLFIYHRPYSYRSASNL